MLLKISGIFFVLLAFIGAFLPLLPTTPFLLVAAACFAKSSPRMHKMLLANKMFGPLIYHWEQSRSIPKRAKIIALSSMFIAVLWSCYILPALWLKLLVVALVAWPAIFVWRLPLSNGNQDMSKTKTPE
ncbi:YbaN family protein [Cognaticolwellia aestuarii]|uniref:YbaN family protein n=1 Tax=Cognaticolwellia aestuarii TaxID=329993 RepID=UPI00098686A5|nr:YbaN family protein [Cognaticolwellia aestuarii]